MSTRIFFTLLFAAIIANSQASAQQPVAPDMYQLSGGTLRITYSTTSIDGKPRFTYRDGSQTLSFAGAQIHHTQTAIGTLVTVTTRQTVDTGSTTFTLLVPAVNLAGPGSPAQIHTVGITTIHKFSVVRAANQGQTQLYTTTELSGTASLVMF